LKDHKLGTWKRFSPALEFFLLMLNPAVYSDLWFPGDRALYWDAFTDFLRTFRD
jgi:hypothetical protein